MGNNLHLYLGQHKVPGAGFIFRNCVIFYFFDIDGFYSTYIGVDYDKIIRAEDEKQKIEEEIEQGYRIIK